MSAPAPDPVPVGSRWRWNYHPDSVYEVAGVATEDSVDVTCGQWKEGTRPTTASWLRLNCTRIDVPEALPPAACCGTCRGRRCEPGWNRCEVCGHLCPVTVPEAPVVERDAKPEKLGCRPGCTPADPCRKIVCPVWGEREKAEGMVERDAVRAALAANPQLARLYRRQLLADLGAEYESSWTGLGALLCPTMGPGR